MSSGKWSRLKEIRQDPLESVGLPSKGDTKLLDHRVQEEYYEHIVAAHQRYQHRFPGGISDSISGLTKAVESVSLRDPIHRPAGEQRKDIDGSESASNGPRAKAPSTQTLLFSMRKLREAFIATHRTDHFAGEAYLFMIRFAISVKEPESYHPSILSFLRVSSYSEDAEAGAKARQEVIRYWILDLACRQVDLPTAVHAAWRYGFLIRFTSANGGLIGSILRCLVRDDYWNYWPFFDQLDEYQRAIVSFADERMRKTAMACLGMAYLKVDREFVRRGTGLEWRMLKEVEKVGWQEEGNMLIIKKSRVR